MTDPYSAEMDPRKVRLGLAIVTVVVVVAIGTAFTIDDAMGRAVMFGVAAVAFVRAFLLIRWLKRERGSSS